MRIVDSTLPELPSPTRTILTCFSYVSPSESDIINLNEAPKSHKSYSHTLSQANVKNKWHHETVITLTSTSIIFKRHLSAHRVFEMMIDHHHSKKLLDLRMQITSCQPSYVFIDRIRYLKMISLIFKFYSKEKVEYSSSLQTLVASEKPCINIDVNSLYSNSLENNNIIIIIIHDQNID